MTKDKLFFFGNSITGSIAQKINWAETSLGEPNEWPECLKLMLGMIYGNKQPVCIFWGPDHLYFYNDGYIPIIGAQKHPWAMGRKGSEVWSEIWDILLPQINFVRNGEGATWHEDQYLTILGDDGNLREAFFTYSYSPVHQPDGKINGVLVTCTETTSRVVAEKKLRESQESLEFALSSAKMGAWEVNLVTSAVRLSEEARKIFGFSNDYNSTDSAIDEFIHPDDREAAREVLRQAIASRKPYDDIYRIVRPDGEIRWVNSKGQARYDYAGNPQFLVGLTFDITEKKLSEMAMENALKARDEFLSIASHELKTPLTSLRLRVDMQKRLIQQNHETIESMDSFLSLTDKQVTRITRLVDDMLDVSRIRTGRLTLRLEQIDLQELMQDMLIRFKDQFLNSSYPFPEVSKSGHSNAIGLWDRIRMEQIISNLLTNAIKYGRNKPVSISLECEEKFVTLIVKDHGIGITPENQRKIFDRFERAVNTNEFSGLGLGLYITKQIVFSLNGEISVQSKLNEGSTFKVKLPK